MKRPARGGAKPPGGAASADDAALFRAEIGAVRPVRANRVEPYRALPSAVPAQRMADERDVIAELGRLAMDGDELEIEEDRLFLRAGLPRDILRKLRRAHWVIQDTIDLHGLTAEEAARATAEFLAECKHRGVRCVRIVHGKGLRSHARLPVLKNRIRKLLQRRDEVLAYVEPREVQGGGGAVVVLLA